MSAKPYQTIMPISGIENNHSANVVSSDRRSIIREAISQVLKSYGHAKGFSDPLQILK
jgi:hypothetical protein